MMELGPGLIIDARDRGNVARLINSSCVPNAESQKWHDAGTGALAARPIKPCLPSSWAFVFPAGCKSAAREHVCTTTKTA